MATITISFRGRSIVEDVAAVRDQLKVVGGLRLDMATKDIVDILDSILEREVSRQAPKDEGMATG